MAGLKPRLVYELCPIGIIRARTARRRWRVRRGEFAGSVMTATVRISAEQRGHVRGSTSKRPSLGSASRPRLDASAREWRDERVQFGAVVMLPRMPVDVQAPLASQYVRDMERAPPPCWGTPGHWPRLKNAGPPSYPPRPLAMIQ